MSKKLFSMISFVLLTTLAASALAADVQWNNASGDRLWRNSANWDLGYVPTFSDKAAIRDSSVSGPIIDGSTTAQANQVILGDWSSSNDTLDMTGGSLTTGSWFILGYGPASNNGTFTMSAGTVNVGSDLYAGFMATGTIEITGGSITVANTFGIAAGGGAGDVFLDGGTISSGAFYMATGAAMDITAGTLIVDSNVTSTINGYISNGWITAYSGSGTLNVDCNVTNPGKTTVTANMPEKAFYPSPINGGTGISINADLSWTAGIYAVSHDVYFGTDPTPDETEFKGNQTETTYDPCTMETSTTYYWRIDEVNGPNMVIGDIWSFETQSCKAFDPSPADGTTVLGLKPILSWMPGPTSNHHDIYFGTDFNDVKDANTSTAGIYRGRQNFDANSYDPCGLEYETTYYWRIDEVNEPIVCNGNIWSFTIADVSGILSWNIEFLGIREPQRTQQQLDAIAERILGFDAAVLALQEIADVSVLEYIRSQLGPLWKIYHSGSWNALLYDENKVEMLSVEMLYNLSNPPYTSYPEGRPIPVSGVFRPVRMYSDPFRVIGIHCDPFSSAVRAEEGEWLRMKVVEFLEDQDEPNDIILLGDLNGQPPGGTPHPQLQQGGYIHLLPKRNGEITHVDGISCIDHFYLTQSAKDKLPKQSAFVIRPEYYGETPIQFEATYSDHYPISIVFKPPTDFLDFASFAIHWMESDCDLQNAWCDRADLTGNGKVDFDDFYWFVQNWLGF